MIVVETVESRSHTGTSDTGRILTPPPGCARPRAQKASRKSRMPLGRRTFLRPRTGALRSKSAFRCRYQVAPPLHRQSAGAPPRLRGTMNAGIWRS